MSHSDRPEALKGLHECMHACRKCLQAGFEVYPRAIFSGGLAASVMIIGQAPGVTEKEAGRPFNAGSGTRLFGWLQDAGFDQERFRSQQYMTAVTKCYPGRAKNGSGDRVPSRREQDLCRPYLDQEIVLIDPRVIIPVGRLAINLFYSPSRPLHEIIGTQHQVEGRWIVPLPHPSGASRWHQSPEHRRLIERALDRLSRLRIELGL